MTDTSGALDLSATVNAANGRDPLAAMKGLYAQDEKTLNAEAKDPKIAKDREAVSDAADKSTKDVHAAYDGIEKLGDRLKPWDAEKELSARQTNPIQAFGSLGAIFAAAASAFTHTPAINAMNGMAAAVNAVKANDEDKYKKAYDAWKENYQLAIERHKEQHEDYEDAMSMADHDINGAKAKLLADSAKYDDAMLRSHLEMGDLEKISQIQQARDSSARGWAEVAPQIEAFHEHMDMMFAAQKELLPAYLKTPQGQQFMAQHPNFDPAKPDMTKLPKDFIGGAALLTQKKEADAKRGVSSLPQEQAQMFRDGVQAFVAKNGRDPTVEEEGKIMQAAKGGGAGGGFGGGIKARYDQNMVRAGGEVNRVLDVTKTFPVDTSGGVFHPNGQTIPGYFRGKLTDEEQTNFASNFGGMDIEMANLLKNGLGVDDKQAEEMTKSFMPVPSDTNFNRVFKLSNMAAKAIVALQNTDPVDEDAKKHRDATIAKLQVYPTPEQVLAADRSGIVLRAKTYGELMDEIKAAGKDAGTMPKVTSDAEYDALPSGRNIQFIAPDGSTRTKP